MGEFLRPPCVSDRDCPDAQVCYSSNLSHVPTNYSACFCNAWWGWTDEANNCEGKTATWFFLLIMLALELILACPSFVLSTIDCVRLVSGARKQSMRIRTILIASLSLPLSLGFYITWRIFTLLSLFNPSGAKVDAEALVWKDGAPALRNETFAQYEITERPFIFCSLLFGTSATSAVGLLWLSVAESIKIMQVDHVSTWREMIALLGVFFGFSIGFIALAVDWTVALMASVPFLAVLIVMLVKGRRGMIDLLHQAISLSYANAAGMGNHDNRYRKEKRALKAINVTALNIILGLSGVLLFGLTYFGFVVASGISPREFDRIGGFSWTTFINELATACILYILLSVFYYMHRNTNKLLNAGGSRRHGVFDDSEEAMPGDRKLSLGPTQATLASSVFYQSRTGVR